MTKVLTRGAWLLLAPAAAAFLLFFAAKDIGAVNHPFFDPCGSVSVSTTAPDTPSDITGTFGIGIGEDCIFRTADDDRNRSNFGGVINFTPTEWGVAADADVDDGALVGKLISDAVLGLFNNPCRTELFISFDLLDATTNISNKIDGRPTGEPDRLSPMAADVDPANGVPDGADRWPSYLDEAFEDVDLSKLHARLFGVNDTDVPGLTVVLNFMIFEPGTQVSDIVAIDPRLGWVNVTVLNDPTTTASNQDPINDFCAPLAVRTTALGTAGSGQAFRTTPAADGAYPFVLFAASQVDADGDGIENTLDPCPYDPDPDWDPRGELIQNPGDMDGDLLPDSCDPFPTEKSLGTCACGISLVDEDLDGWMNGADNCPLDSNVDQADSEPVDGIGDACDRNPGVRDGEPITFVCLIDYVLVGAATIDDAALNEAELKALAPCDPTATVDLSGGDGGGGGGGDGTTGDGTTGGGTTGGGTTGGGTTGGGTTGGGGGGVGGGPDSGVGSLSPVGSSVPLWAVAVLAVSTVGLLAGIGLTTRTIRGQRREE